MGPMIDTMLNAALKSRQKTEFEHIVDAVLVVRLRGV